MSGPEQPNAVVNEQRTEFDREEFDLILDRQLAKRRIASDIRFMQVAVPFATARDPKRGDVSSSDGRTPALVPQYDQCLEIVAMVQMVAGFGLGMPLKGTSQLVEPAIVAPFTSATDPAFHGFRDGHAERAEVQEKCGHRARIGLRRGHRLNPPCGGESLARRSNQVVVPASAEGGTLGADDGVSIIESS